MPTASCRCQCKLCRTPGAAHCRAAATCGAPARLRPATAPDGPAVAEVLRRLKADAGSHSPSVAQLERALPGLVRIDACFLSNPYATKLMLRRLCTLQPERLERMVSHYPSQSGAIAAMLAPAVGVPEEQLVVANGACELIEALLGQCRGPVLLSLPTFSAYYEAAKSPVVVHRLAADRGFALDLDALDALVDRHAPDTVVVINPNNPDGGLVDRGALIDFVVRLQGRVRQVIVDESFLAFSSLEPPHSLAGLVGELPHLVVLNSLSKSHGIAGLRLGYAVAAPLRAQQLRAGSLWNVNAFAEWCCGLLADDGYRLEYETARRQYVRSTRAFLDLLPLLPGVTAYPSAANFALLELDRPAADVAHDLLVGHGVYVRDCADKWGLGGDRYLRVAARTADENGQIIAALADVLARPPQEPAPRTRRRTPARTGRRAPVAVA